MLQQVRQALHFVPSTIREAVEGLPAMERIEEIRLRRGRRVTYLAQGKEHALRIVATDDILQATLDAATAQSHYAAQEMLKRGFVTVVGGHRLGVCGTGVYQNGELRTIKDVSSINLRIARQLHGVADSAADYLWTHPRSVLIIGAPGSGKTTLLRDLIRQLSDRFQFRVGVVDERMELAACVEGKPQFDLGCCSDTLSGVRKEEGIEMLLRSMNPQWIALDEITAQKDVEAMLRASYCGVHFLATAHAHNRMDLQTRPVYRLLFSAGIFETLITIDKNRRIQTEGLTNA